MDDAQPWPARDAPADELLERTHLLRRELLRRGESLPAGWVEEAARDLKTGELSGYWVPGGDGGAPGIAFYSLRARRAYAHVHVDEGKGRRERARSLLRSLIHSLPGDIQRADIGLSGLPTDEEEILGREAVGEFGGVLVIRMSLERPIGPDDEPVPANPLMGCRNVPIRSIPPAQLAELDWRAFHGTPDENLIADTLEEDQRGLEELLRGRLGRFLDDASEALVTADSRLVAAVLVAEHSAQRALVLDLVVDPSERKKGVATYLLRRSFRALRALGFSTARLWVTETNAPALGLYRTLGFVVASVARIYRWSPTLRHA